MVSEITSPFLEAKESHHVLQCQTAPVEEHVFTGAPLPGYDASWGPNPIGTTCGTVIKRISGERKSNN